MDRKAKLRELNSGFKKLLDQCPELVFAGDEILRKEGSEVSLKEGISIGDKLKTTLKKCREVTGFGRGLAAPQIGESKSVFVTYIEDIFKTYINPHILKSSAKNNLYRESCLSTICFSADVKRPESIHIEYLSESGKKENESVDGFIARLIQHEYDHLNGILSIDVCISGSIEFMLSNPLKEQLREVV